MCNSLAGLQIYNDFDRNKKEAISKIMAKFPEDYKLLKNLLAKTNVTEVSSAGFNYGFEEDGCMVERGQFKFKVVYQYNDVLDLPLFEANDNPRQFVWCFGLNN